MDIDLNSLTPMSDQARISRKPITKLRQLLTNIKDQDDKPHYWLGLCAMPNLQYQLLSTTDPRKLVY